jgi:hypothetical protein
MCAHTHVVKRFLVTIDAHDLKLWECLRSRYCPFAGSASDIKHAVDPREIQSLWEYLPRLEMREVKLKQARESHSLFPLWGG